MKQFFFFFVRSLILISFLTSGDKLSAQDKIKVLIVTGGHDFQYEPFYEVFNSMPGITYDTVRHPRANSLIASTDVDRYDVLLFYDMADSLSSSQQQAYINLLNRGTSMIFLHHSLVSYQNWNEFVKIVGGQYHTRPVVVNGDTLRANYEHDVTIPVKVEDANHPVTKGLLDFEIYDEIYGDVEILPSVKPLLSTSHPGSMRFVAWINHYGNSDVFYLQLGHGETAFSDRNFRKLVQQGIEWSAKHHSNFRKSRYQNK